MTTPLVKQNDIYLYFETIRQLRAESVLDIGMTLKRCGAISRQVADSAIDPQVYLCGIDLDPETTCPIYQCLYQEILSPEELLQKGINSAPYDLAMLLNLPKESLTDQALLDFIKGHARYLLADNGASKTLMPFFSNNDAKTITLDTDTYLLIHKC